MNDFDNGYAQKLLNDMHIEHVKDLSERDDSDYIFNREQFDKFVKAYEYFVEMAALNHGRIESVDIVPRMQHGNITAYFTSFYVRSEMLARLSDIIGDMSALSIDSSLDGEVCISFNIPDVFIRNN